METAPGLYETPTLPRGKLGVGDVPGVESFMLYSFSNELFRSLDCTYNDTTHNASEGLKFFIVDKV